MRWRCSRSLICWERRVQAALARRSIRMSCTSAVQANKDRGISRRNINNSATRRGSIIPE